MLDFEELDVDFLLESVGEVVVERVGEDAVDDFLYQVNQTVLLDLVNVVEVELEFLDLFRDLVVLCLQLL